MEEVSEVSAPLVTAEEAREWVERLKSGAILALLKDPDHALHVSRAFFGFRPDAKSYGNTLVRSRLAQAAVKDSLFAKKLRSLAELTSGAPVEQPGPRSAPAISAEERKPDKTETRHKAESLQKMDALRTDRDQRRRERDEARQALAAAQAERDESVKLRLKAEAERDDSQRLMKKQTERIARLERQTQKQHEVETRLVRALNQDKSPHPSPRIVGAAPVEAAPKGSVWLSAVHRWLDKSKFDQALIIAMEVLKSETDDTEALEIAVRAWEGRNDSAQAAPYLRRLLTIQISRRDYLAAAESLGRLLRLVSEPPRAETEARRFLSSLSAQDSAAIEAGRRLLTRLRGADPTAHAWLAALITTHTTLGPALMPPPGALGPDDPLPLRLTKGYPQGQPITARLLCDAVDQGSAALVDGARTALSALEKSDPAQSARLWAALTDSAGDDLSRLLPLRRTPRGPIVVDGSNVAWFDQESLTHGKPRIRHLWEIRRVLRGRGFFPVALYADANLPYFIDEPAALRLMIARRELLLVDAGVVADEVLLRQAKHLTAPLVTNDKMEDWDPEGEVPKVRYTISLAGEAHLLSDI